MKDLIFSDRAARSFQQIAEYSRERYGRDRGAAYLDQLIGRCDALTRGEVPFRDCRDVFAPDLRTDLRFARAGRHFIIFMEMVTRVLIVDFIHQSADVGGRLGGPEE
jgi:toxin ParE1/3/4